MGIALALGVPLVISFGEPTILAWLDSNGFNTNHGVLVLRVSLRAMTSQNIHASSLLFLFASRIDPPTTQPLCGLLYYVPKLIRHHHLNAICWYSLS